MNLQYCCMQLLNNLAMACYYPVITRRQNQLVFNISRIGILQSGQTAMAIKLQHPVATFHVILFCHF